MKTELESQDIEAIADKVAEKLKPLIVHNGKSADDDILDVQGVADYLKMSKQWVYDRVHNNKIPFYKVGKYPRFRKSQIDEWFETFKRGSRRKPVNNVRRLLEDAAYRLDNSRS